MTTSDKKEGKMPKHCRYINDDDGDDMAWCVQSWAKCPYEENQEECCLFAEDSFAISQEPK